jgi:hypothetical protein
MNGETKAIAQVSFSKPKYGQLWWDMHIYANMQLPRLIPGDFEKSMNNFAQREANIMSAAAPAST